MPRPKELEIAGAGTLRFILGLLLIYGLGHFIFNFAHPYSPQDYSLKTCSKAYFDCFATMTCFFWLISGPYGFYLKPTWPRTLISIIFFTLLGNVIIRANMFLQGFQATDGLSGSSVDFFSTHLPVINMYAGIFTLRNITPIATVVLLMIATSPGWWRRSRLLTKNLTTLSLSLCLVGAILSGGRATLIFCFLLIFLVMLVRKKIAFVAISGMLAILSIIFVNVFSGLINDKAPAYIARSVQLVMIDKGSTYRSIEGSQETRDAGKKAALVEWKKDNRVLFFGRSVYSMSWEEASYINQKYGMDGFVMNAMRSGRTHNLLTDLLLQYGIFGCVLYLASYIAIIIYFWRLAKVIDSSEGEVKALVLSMVVYLPAAFVYALAGGTYMPSIAVLVIGITRSHLATLRTTESSGERGTVSTAAHASHGRLPRPVHALSKVNQAR
jgi:O-antigen ligase